MSILFCTSFNKELYDASGKDLLESFTKHQKEGEIFCGIEGGEFIKGERILNSDLDKIIFLQSWLYANKDIIPKYLGGEAKPCDCTSTPFKRIPRESHKKGCHFSWFNRNVSRWFRKIATIYSAYNFNNSIPKGSDFKYLIWIDSDCFFKDNISVEKLKKIFTDTFSLFYMKGKRQIPETGFFGLDLGKKGARNFLYQYFNYYQTKRYRQYHRWDDSNILYMILKENTAAKCIAKDIVPKVPLGLYSDVIEHSILSSYIGHNKGLHGRKLGIMK